VVVVKLGLEKISEVESVAHSYSKSTLDVPWLEAQDGVVKWRRREILEGNVAAGNTVLI
jgi:hypothetical protein